MQSTENKLVTRIYGRGRGWSFSKIDFSEIGSDDLVRKALSNLTAKRTIRRVLRGVYDYPQFSKLLKEQLAPDLDQLAQAIARKSGWRIQASENRALNLLGLSTQVPAKTIYLSDGPSKSYRIGERELVFKKSSLKESVFKLRESQLVVQALKSLGNERIDSEVCEKLKIAIKPTIWKKMVNDTKTAPAWVYEVIKKISDEVRS